MKYQIVERTTDSIYCIVTRDDGSTFGQFITGQMMKMKAGIEAKIVEVLDTQEAASKDTPVDAEVIALATSKEEVTIIKVPK